jgi:D-alanyl-lipoteichoic acid acyltransferase DltB (MBOAT superfamily)
MLFNSYAFILVFLPSVFAVHSFLRRQGLDRSAVAFLALASIVFYGWWSPVYVLLIGILILANYAAVQALLAAASPRARKWLLALGAGGNLCVLGYFKYSNFFIDNLNALLGVDFYLQQVVLPLGISFFTFQKIALLADAYQGKIRTLNFLDYALFVLFFPQLIAGPIVHHSEAMPQFQARGNVPVRSIAMGITIFTIGLAKKVLLADSLAGYATPQFDAAAASAPLTFFGAWSGALAYTLQLYFDFSGYSDMAIGAALLFGVRLPLNFNSPYKAGSIIEFWRRWHMTLSRFLRDYLYIPLGGNRQGKFRRYLNLFITMLLGGLWHGAGWTFVFWGALHGFYLGVNHAWDALQERSGRKLGRGRLRQLAGQALTFLAVVIGWVFFRSDDLPAAFSMLRAMTGIAHTGSLTALAAEPSAGVDLRLAFMLIGALLALVWLAPNTQELTAYVPFQTEHLRAYPRRVPQTRLRWRPSPRWAAFAGCAAAASLLSLSKVSEFLYFQF